MIDGVIMEVYTKDDLIKMAAKNDNDQMIIVCLHASPDTACNFWEKSMRFIKDHNIEEKLRYYAKMFMEDHKETNVEIDEMVKNVFFTMTTEDFLRLIEVSKIIHFTPNVLLKLVSEPISKILNKVELLSFEQIKKLKKSDPDIHLMLCFINHASSALAFLQRNAFQMFMAADAETIDKAEDEIIKSCMFLNVSSFFNILLTKKIADAYAHSEDENNTSD